MASLTQVRPAADGACRSAIEGSSSPSDPALPSWDRACMHTAAAWTTTARRVPPPLYNASCNQPRIEDLREFVARDVMINGTDRGLDAYADGQRTVVRAFPDFRWELRDLVAELHLCAGDLADEMPVHNEGGCVGGRDPARVWLLHASSGHVEPVAASHE